MPLFGPGRPVFKVRRSRAKFHVFVAVISELGMCRDCDNRVKIPRFCCGYFRLMCATRQESCENSAFSLRLFPACVCVSVYVCICVCVSVYVP